MVRPGPQRDADTTTLAEQSAQAAPLSPDVIYPRLLNAFTPVGTEDAFDAHTLASILTLAAQECAATPASGHKRKNSLAEAAGYDDAGLLARFFPAMTDWLCAGFSCALVRGEDELCLIDLLQRGSSAHSQFEELLASMVARRCQRPNHLWQDLGLGNRGELSLLMNRHFGPLARRNVRDMRWKKFFYRTLCRDEGYALCTAPSCSECCDFDACFGAENGESLLAQVRRRAEQAA